LFVSINKFEINSIYFSYDDKFNIDLSGRTNPKDLITSEFAPLLNVTGRQPPDSASIKTRPNVS
jgi:hypothetical protein